MAERLLALNQKPVASLQKALEIGKVKELADEPVGKEEALHQLQVDTEYWITDTAELVKLAEDAGDSVTADMFTGYLKEYQKLLWMVKAYAG